MSLKENRGVFIAFSIILLWFGSMYFCLAIFELNWKNPISYLLFLVQTHLYTGLFITAHDSMHGGVSKNKTLNESVGRVCTTLFAFNFYGNLFKKHHLHHRFVATDGDPDFHKSDNFWIWYLSFAKQYINIWQILLMAITFNVLKLFFPESNIIFYWALPSVVSTFQLFYFGTYLPHRGEHDNSHFSKSQKKNHVLAFLSCYFFGYHYEHHISPNTPWWKLPQVKEQMDTVK